MNDNQPSPAFKQIKTLIEEYSDTLSFRDIKATKPRYHLWSEKEVEIEGRKKKGVYFAGVIQQKNFVGFYFMPVYSDPDKMKKVFSPDLLRLLKGKSCFHIKKLTPSLKRDIARALELGYKEYQQKGWI